MSKHLQVTWEPIVEPGSKQGTVGFRALNHHSTAAEVSPEVSCALASRCILRLKEVTIATNWTPFQVTRSSFLLQLCKRSCWSGNSSTPALGGRQLHLNYLRSLWTLDTDSRCGCFADFLQHAFTYPYPLPLDV